MLVVWRGFGWLVPVIVFAALILSQLSVDDLYGEGFYTANAWPDHAAYILGAIAVGLLGLVLNHVKRKIPVDEKTGEPLGKAASHSLFFMPVEYWAIIVLALVLWPQP